MEHCSSLPLWRPDRRVQQISGGTGHRPSRSDVPCRDDGSGQTARWVVATRPRVRRLVGLFLNGHPQVAASRRPRTEASARLSASPRFARASTLLRGGRERRSARLGLSRSMLHAACAIDKLRRREAPSSARWVADCATVRARSSTSDGGSPERWRRSNGPGLSTNQSVLSPHPTNANSRAWQHSLRSRSTCRYQIGGGVLHLASELAVRAMTKRRRTEQLRSSGRLEASLAPIDQHLTTRDLARRWQVSVKKLE